MNIYILEDDTFQQQRLKRLIETIIKKHKLQNTRIFAATYPNDIMKEINANLGYSIYFLDIEIKERKGSKKLKNQEEHISSGFELAKKIREIDSFGWLVFVTTHSELFRLTAKSRLTTLDFIEKGSAEIDFDQSIEECLMLAYSKKSNLVAEDSFVFKNQQSEFQIPFGDILYFETTEITHKIRMIAKTRISEFYANMKEIVTIDDRLFQCNRSYVVNLANIESIDKKNRRVLFENGAECDIARTKLSTLLKQFEEFHSIGR